MLKRWVNLLLSFLVGLAGNLMAGWIQQDIWSNLFTPTRILGTAVGVGLTLLVIAWLEKQRSARANRREEETREKVIRDSINALDNYEKAVLREFFIQKRNSILVSEEDTAVAGLLRKGIIRIISDGRYLLGVGWVCLVSLSPSVATIMNGSSPQVIGFLPGIPTPEQIQEIQKLRPGFVWDIERSHW